MNMFLMKIWMKSSISKIDSDGYFGSIFQKKNKIITFTWLQI